MGIPDTDLTRFGSKSPSSWIYFESNLVHLGPESDGVLIFTQNNVGPALCRDGNFTDPIRFRFQFLDLRRPLIYSTHSHWFNFNKNLSSTRIRIWVPQTWNSACRKTECLVMVKMFNETRINKIATYLKQWIVFKVNEAHSPFANYSMFFLKSTVMCKVACCSR
jgi:hypothetical protein